MRDATSRVGWLHTAAAVFATAVPFNYVWELAQSPLYRNQPPFPARAWHCFVASLGDGVILLFIWAAGAFAFRTHAWFVTPRAWRYSLMLGLGVFSAAVVEAFALSTGRWSYGSGMPRWGQLGLIPVFQMLILPPLIFVAAATMQRRLNGDTS